MNLPYPEERVLAFIRNELNLGKPMPHIGKVASHMGWKEMRPAQQICQILAKKGYLTTHDGRHFQLNEQETKTA